MRYKLKSDIIILDRIIPKETILTVIDNISIYEFGDGFKQEISLGYIQTISDEIIDTTLNIEEIDSDVDDAVKNWRIQLDVKCSLSKLKELEIVLKENIDKILWN